MGHDMCIRYPIPHKYAASAVRETPGAATYNNLQGAIWSSYGSKA